MKKTSQGTLFLVLSLFAMSFFYSCKKDNSGGSTPPPPTNGSSQLSDADSLKYLMYHIMMVSLR